MNRGETENDLVVTPSLETDVQFCTMLPRFSLKHGRDSGMAEFELQISLS